MTSTLKWVKGLVLLLLLLLALLIIGLVLWSYFHNVKMANPVFVSWQ